MKLLVVNYSTSYIIFGRGQGLPCQERNNRLLDGPVCAFKQNGR